MMMTRGCVLFAYPLFCLNFLVLLSFFKTLNIATHKKKKKKKNYAKKKVKNVSQSIFHRSIIDARAMMKKKT